MENTECPADKLPALETVINDDLINEIKNALRESASEKQRH